MDLGKLTIAAIIALAPASTAGAQAVRPPDAAIQLVVTSLVEAQRTFDLKRLDDVLAPDYVEISPVGEVDPRAKVMTFYTPDKKISDLPIAALDEIVTRVYDTTAVTVARVTYQMKAPGGTTATRAMRCVFVTRLTGGQWKVVSTQYTPIRN